MSQILTSHYYQTENCPKTTIFGSYVKIKPGRRISNTENTKGKHKSYQPLTEAKIHSNTETKPKHQSLNTNKIDAEKRCHEAEHQHQLCMNHATINICSGCTTYRGIS